MERNRNQTSNSTETVLLTDCRERLLISQSKDSCGYTREFAVRALASHPSEETVKALIVRANDWVPIIRQCAKSILLDMLSESSASYYAKNLNHLYHLRKCGRSEHSDFVRDIEGRLRLYRNALIDAVTTGPAESARLSAELLIKSNSSPREELINICLTSPHESVRRYSLSQVSKFSSIDINVVRDLALFDKSAKVRCEAFRKLTRLDEEGANLIARKLLFDAHSGVRSAAIFQLKKSDVDCVSQYSSMLNEGTPRIQKIAVWGLMELFSKAKLDEILRKLDSSYPSVRLQALRACYVLCEESDLDELLKKMLMDDSFKIVKESALMMEKSCITIPLDQFREIIFSQRTVKAYAALLRTTHKLNKWQQLIFLSELSLENNKSLSAAVEITLVRWVDKINNFYVDPTALEISKILAFDRRFKRFWSTPIKNVIAQRFSLCEK